MKLVLVDVIQITTQITDNKLNDSNFLKWCKIVCLYLWSIGKASHLTSEPPPTRDRWLQDDARFFLQIKELY